MLIQPAEPFGMSIGTVYGEMRCQPFSLSASYAVSVPWYAELSSTCSSQMMPVPAALPFALSEMKLPAQPVGDVVQQNAIGKIRFNLEAGGQVVGSLNAENWRAWNFNIQDHTGAEVARITKTWEGLGKAIFTTADNYVVQIHRPLDDPLRSLVVAAALTVDTALKQDDKNAL